MYKKNSLFSIRRCHGYLEYGVCIMWVLDCCELFKVSQVYSKFILFGKPHFVAR
jgi:hypothetical protein